MNLWSFSCCITLAILTINYHYKPYNPRVNARIAAGFEHSLVIEGGQVYAWGNNRDGQIGYGEDNFSANPIPIERLNDVIALAQGSAANHALALKEDGTVWAWGDNEYGQLGIGSKDVINISAARMLDGIYGVVALAVGRNHSLVLKDDGSVWSWGDNANGQLGHQVQSSSFSPKRINGLNDIVAVSAGYYHSMALHRDGTVWTWGKNSNGQLGLNSTENKSKPVQVKGLSNVVSISAGASHCVALNGDGTVWAWGWNDYGQLGDGSLKTKLAPIRINVKNVVRISAGGLHTIGLTTEGNVYAWGTNTFGQLGKSAQRNYPKPVKVFSLKNIISIAAGDMHSIAVAQDGTVKTWGANSNYQLGMEDELSSATAFDVFKIKDKLPTALVALNREVPTILPIKNKFEPINESLVEKDIAFNANGSTLKGGKADDQVNENQQEESTSLVPDDFGSVSEDDCPVEYALKSINLNVFCSDKNNTVDIRWKAPLDITSLEFVIEKSVDNNTWIETDLKPTVTEKRNYYLMQVTDQSNAERMTHYRLRQLNCSEEFKYSALGIINCNLESEKDIYVEPELIQDYFVFTLKEGISKGYKYEIIDSYNRTVTSETIKKNKATQSVTISAKSLQEGLYLFRIVDLKGKNELFKKKIFKVSK